MKRKTKWLLITYLGLPLFFFFIAKFLSRNMSGEEQVTLGSLMVFPTLVGCTTILLSSYRFAKKGYYVFFFPWLIYTLVHYLTLDLLNQIEGIDFLNSIHS